MKQKMAVGKNRLISDEEKKYILEIKDLKKKFGPKQVLKGINLSLKLGDKLGVLGANGCGKTTLVEIICQTQKASSGKIIYNFQEKNPKKAIGIQFQEGNWPSSLSAKDIVKFYLEIYPYVKKSWINQIVESFGMTEFYSRSLNRLSGGQKQRFNAMLAILHKPELTILDEVSNGLDLELKHNIVKFLKEYLNDKKRNLIIVSHNPDLIQSLCNRLIIIDDGIILLNNSIKEIIKKYTSVSELMSNYFDEKLDIQNPKAKKISGEDK